MSSLVRAPDPEDGPGDTGGPHVRDLRMPAVGLSAWLGGLGGLLAPAPSAVAAAGVSLVALVLARNPGLRRTVTACVLAALAVGVSALLRDLAVQEGPVAVQARARSAVTAQLTLTSDPRTVHGQFSTSIVVRAVVERLDGRGTSHDLHTPVLLIADESWQEVELGSRLSVRARLAPAEGHDVAAVLTPFGPPPRASPPSVWWRGSAAVRSAIRSATEHRPLPERALVPALVDGDDQALPERVQEEFRTSGLTHLLAVSGTNLTLVVGFLLVVGRWCGVRGRWQYLLGVIGIIGFILLARTEPSVVRAAAMGSVALIGMGANGRDRGVRALGVAVVGLLLWDPWLATSVGFALSVLATAGILLWAPGWSVALSRWLPLWAAQALAVPTAAQLACTPVVCAISGQVSLVAVAANMVVAPLVGPATVLGLLGGLLAMLWVPLGQVLGTLSVWCAWAIIEVAHRAAGTALPAIEWGTGWLALLVLTALCGLVAVTLGPLLSRRLTGLTCCVLMLVVVLVPMPTPGWPPRGWVVAACDVGQGDALVLNAGKGNGVVVDAGPDPAAVDGCLDDLDVTRVPALVVTHFHADHVDGIAGVYDGRPVEEVLVTGLPDPPAQFAAVRREAGATMRVPAYGETRQVGDVWWQVVGPVGGLVTPEDPNNSSLVLVATVRGVSVLLTGDVEPEGQADLAASLPDLDVDVLKVPHHGSRHQDIDFLTAASPEVAIASVGEENTYGHPAPDTLGPLEEAGAEVYRTDRDGDVVVGEDLAVHTRG